MSTITDRPDLSLTFEEAYEMYPSAEHIGVAAGGTVFLYDSEGVSMGAIGTVCPPLPPLTPELPQVPLPAAGWLLISALIGLVVVKRSRL